MEKLLLALQQLTMFPKIAISIVLFAFASMLVIAARVIAFAIAGKKKKRPVRNTFKKSPEVLELQDAARSYLLLICLAVLMIYLSFGF